MSQNDINGTHRGVKPCSPYEFYPPPCTRLGYSLARLTSCMTGRSASSNGINSQPLQLSKMSSNVSNCFNMYMFSFLTQGLPHNPPLSTFRFFRVASIFSLSCGKGSLAAECKTRSWNILGCSIQKAWLIASNPPHFCPPGPFSKPPDKSHTNTGATVQPTTESNYSSPRAQPPVSVR